MSLNQLSRLLPLPEEDLQQVLDYASTLSKQEGVSHFTNLLGESPQSIEFISSFNSRRQAPTPAKPNNPPTQSTDSDGGVPKFQRRAPKKKTPLHTPAARQIQETFAGQGTAYNKKNEDDYMSKRPAPNPASGPSNAFSIHPNPVAVQSSTPKQTSTPKPPPSASGPLISDLHKPKSKPTPSQPPTKPKQTKITITGGQSMHGSSTTLSALDSAIRTLEISTNTSLLPSSTARKCNCIATRHPLLAAAPNCLNCGKVICVKEGFGPCTFCGTPLLTALEIQGMIHSLREERGREKMSLDATTQKKAESSKTPLPFSAPTPANNMSPAEAAAKAHRDRLLAFQSQNAKRTTVRDEAADFEVPDQGTNMWASPQERARQLKMQQKVLAEQEWNARPEYEKRRQVVSIDLVKGKVVRRMGAVEKPKFDLPESEGEEEEDREVLKEVSANIVGGGSFSRNPLLRAGLIKPVWKMKEGEDVVGEEVVQRTWGRSRVQDDLADNEAVILDGGAFGGEREEGAGREEPACG